MINRDFAKGSAMVIGAGVLWGVYGCMSQYLFASRGVSTEWFLAIKMLLAGALMVTINLAKNGKAAVKILTDKKRRISFIAFVIFGSICVQYTYLLTIKYSNAATATAIQYTYPVMIILWLAVKNRRKPALAELLCMVLAAAGTFLISTHGSIGTLSISPLSLVIGLISAVCMVVYTVEPVFLIRKYGAFSLISWSMLISGIVFSLAFTVWNKYVPLDAAGMLIMAFSVICGTVMPFTMFLSGAAKIGSTRAGIFGNVEPASSALIAFGILGTPFAAADIIGIALILSTVVIIALVSKA